MEELGREIQICGSHSQWPISFDQTPLPNCKFSYWFVSGLSHQWVQLQHPIRSNHLQKSHPQLRVRAWETFWIWATTAPWDNIHPLPCHQTRKYISKNLCYDHHRPRIFKKFCQDPLNNTRFHCVFQISDLLAIEFLSHSLHFIFQLGKKTDKYTHLNSQIFL